MAQDFTDDCFASDHVVQTDMQNIENNFAALKSAFSGAAAPANTVAGMWWFDTATNILKLRNEANNGWQSVWDFANGKPVITNLSNEITGGMISSTIKNPATGTYGLRTLGTTSTSACAGNDSRLLTTVMTKGDNLIGRNDNVYTTNSTDYEAKLGFTMIQSGEFRFKFSLKESGSYPTTYARIYRNGVAVGTQRSTTSTSYVLFSEDISGWSIGDQCTLFMKITSAGYTASLKEFRVYVATATIGVPIIVY